MEFIRPSLEYLDSYLEAYSYFEKEKSIFSMVTTEEIKKDKEKYIDGLNNLETEKYYEVNSFLITSTTYWLVDIEKKEFIGYVEVYHRLTEELYDANGHIDCVVAPQHRKKGYGNKLGTKGIEIAKELKLCEILINCDFDNIGLKKIIENNEGIFFSEDYHKGKKRERYRMIFNHSAQKMWRRFLEIWCADELRENEFNYYCFQFSRDADELAELAKMGVKKATVSLVFSCENKNIIYPKVGDYNIILNSKDEAVCIVKIIKIEKRKYIDVDEQFAILEGEGDKTLLYWRKVHEEKFKKSLEEHHLKFDCNLDLYLERFKLMYK